MTDDKLSDWAIIQNDKDLYVGDWGIEQVAIPGQLRSFAKEAAKTTTLLDPNGFPLVQRFPDKSITPIRGRYTENVIATAKSYLRTPYVWGSDRTEPSSFDCSDFTRWVYLYALGMDLPWDSRSQAAYVKAFSKRQYRQLRKARRGDLLFFTKFYGNRPQDYAGLKESQKPITHMGIYLGNGKIIHTASKETGGVRIDNLRFKHLEYRFLFGGGILD
ncbi:C40 family peptidase [Paenibacillus sedimenti]|uniref:C40 family peptidase n=1 Tax=Paenibacillus sedimenti TaxID=2770274 RepID=UPI00289E912C|nr:C40 family peptidase [Paenibacillus sedimenti]